MSILGYSAAGAALGYFLGGKKKQSALLGALGGAILGALRGPTGSGSLLGALTRPSCLECVEKHLGSACVMLSEIESGYPYKLRVIGHLHEDESQAYPLLHAAIRDARKAYQTEGSVPDFQGLQKLIEAGN
jgi:hypothetical protein